MWGSSLPWQGCVFASAETWDQCPVWLQSLLRSVIIIIVALRELSSGLVSITLSHWNIFIHRVVSNNFGWSWTVSVVREDSLKVIVVGERQLQQNFVWSLNQVRWSIHDSLSLRFRISIEISWVESRWWLERLTTSMIAVAMQWRWNVTVKFLQNNWQGGVGWNWLFAGRKQRDNENNLESGLIPISCLF